MQIPNRICTGMDYLQALYRGAFVESEFCEIRIDPKKTYQTQSLRARNLGPLSRNKQNQTNRKDAKLAKKDRCFFKKSFPTLAFFAS